MMHNLQKTAHEYATASNDFRETTEDTSALRLQICIQWDKDNANQISKIRTFWSHLQSLELELFADRLETITQYKRITGHISGHEFARLAPTKTKVCTDEHFGWLVGGMTPEHLGLSTCATCPRWEMPEPSENHYF
jgi:hypothetical protein